MPAWLVGESGLLLSVAAKVVLMYAVALVGLRVAHRRTLAQWTAIDFAAAVAIGAIVGRTAIATGESFAVGAVALVTLLAAHWVVTMSRYQRWFAKAVDHRVRVIVAGGRVRRGQLLLCGLTENDVLSRLRQRGVGDVRELRYVLYETKGELTIVPETGGADTALVRAGLVDAAGYRVGSPPPAAGAGQA